MAFKKGEPRPANAGRLKGSKNKRTAITCEYIQQVLDGFPAESLIKDIKKIKDPAKRAMILIDLFEFILPRKSRVQHVSVDEEGKEQTFQIAGQTIVFK